MAISVGSGKEDDYHTFHDTMDMQMVRLKPCGANARARAPFAIRFAMWHRLRIHHD